MGTHDCFLHVRHTWQGEPLAPKDTCSVELSLHHHVPIVSGDDDDWTGGLGVRELQIAIDAPFHGDPEPPPTNFPRRCREGLWEFEVVEIFIGGPPSAEIRGLQPYLELEFGPHGHALGLVFDAYRQRREAFEVDCDIYLRGARWQVRATIPFHRLPPLPWHVNAFAMHGVGPDRVHAAAGHADPSRTPDFHDRSTWLPCPMSWPIP